MYLYISKDQLCNVCFPTEASCSNCCCVGVRRVRWSSTRSVVPRRPHTVLHLAVKISSKSECKKWEWSVIEHGIHACYVYTLHGTVYQGFHKWRSSTQLFSKCLWCKMINMLWCWWQISHFTTLSWTTVVVIN